MVAVAIPPSKLIYDGDIDYALNGTKPKDLPSNDLLRQTLVDCKFEVVLAGGSSDPTKTEDSPLNFIRLIEVVEKGKSIRKMSGRAAYWHAYWRRGVAPTLVSPAISGTGTYTFAVQLPIDWAGVGKGMLLPDKSILRTYREGNFQIRITYGTTADLMTGGDRTITVQNMSCKLIHESAGGAVTPRLRRWCVAETRDIAAANTKETIPFDYDGGIQYRSFMVLARRAGVRSNALISTFNLEGGPGNSILKDVPEDAIRREMESFAGIANPVGVYFIDFDRSKRWADTLDTTGFGNLKLIMNVAAPSGTTDIEVIPDRVEEIKG